MTNPKEPAPISTDAFDAGASDARYRLLIESVKDYAIFMIDPGGLVTTWNIGAERMKGYVAREILGKHFSVFYATEDAAAGKCEHELAVATREGRYEEEGWRVRKDGSKFWASVIITPLRSVAGALLGFTKVTQDLTARVQAEHQRALSLEMAAAAQRKDDFLAVISHELRNPLASIVATVELARMHGSANMAQVATIGRHARQMTRLVDDLLDASRSLRDDVPLVPGWIALGRLVADAVEVASPLMAERDHVLTVDVPDGGLLVKVDAERMTQVFGNILSNAAKHSSRGGHVHVGASANEDQVVITVTDSGDGIAPEFIGQIFEPFVQGEQGLERKRGGLGVGLSIARKLVRAHRGELHVESPGVGKGSRFTVSLPRESTPSTSDTSPPPPSTPGGSGRRILLIDDNDDFVEALASFLQGLGHQTMNACDGPTGIAAASHFLPELVFLDIGLPGASGYEVVLRLRALSGCETIPIIALTGYAREADRAAALRAGFTDHISKPIEPQRIARVVADSLHAA